MLLLFLAFLGGVHASQRTVMFIGDGISDVTIQRISKEVSKGYSSVHHRVTPYVPYGEEVPESASSASAMFTGCNLDPLAVSYSKSTGAGVRGMLEFSRERGRKIGVVTTSCVLDATVASFLTHGEIRYDYKALGKHLNTDVVDVYMGGSTNLVDWGQPSNYCHMTTKKDLMEARYCDKYRLIGEFADKNNIFSNIGCSFMPSSPNKTHEFPSLKDMVREALLHLERVSGPEGFLLVVSSDQIDHAYHASDSYAADRELSELTDAIDFTLSDHFIPSSRTSWRVVFTSDHETEIFSGKHGNGDVGITVWTSDQFSSAIAKSHRIRQKEVGSFVINGFHATDCPEPLAGYASDDDSVISYQVTVILIGLAILCTGGGFLLFRCMRKNALIRNLRQQ